MRPDPYAMIRSAMGMLIQEALTDNEVKALTLSMAVFNAAEFFRMGNPEGAMLALEIARKQGQEF